MKLNLGSYLFPLEGYHNVDILAWKGVDEVADLNRLPWPWKDGTFSEVRAYDIIEHLGKLTKVEIMSELARITRPGGLVSIRVPSMYHPSSLQSLQHAHVFYLDSFERNYAQPHFELVSRSVSLNYGGREIPFRSPLRLPIRLLGRLGMLHTITFELRKG